MAHADLSNDFTRKTALGHNTNARVRTAAVMVASVVLLSGFALYSPLVITPQFSVISLSFAFIVVGLCSFEAVRLLSRNPESAKYDLVFGSTLLLIFLLRPLEALLSVSTKGAASSFGVMAASLAIVVLLLSEKLDTQKESCTVLSFLLISVCGSALITLSSLSGSVGILWWLFGIIAVNDSAAYFVGKKWGRIKLAPKISPNKTVEGSLAGLVTGAVLGTLTWSYLLPFHMSWPAAVLVSVGVIVAAQISDLAKSAVKRKCGVKDTGAFFPGHGGFLDRFDGALGGGAALLCGAYLFSGIRF